MKEYKYVRIHKKLLGGYYTSKQSGQLSHREVIDTMARKGWRYIDHIPVDVSGEIIASYDLVFERDADEFYEDFQYSKE